MQDDFHRYNIFPKGIPVLVEEPRDLEVRFGNTVYFRCRADPDPSIIIWLQNR